MSFVPIYALIRAYYSYKEWMAYGPRTVFVLKLAYCMSQIAIFAGWYSDQSSKLGEITWPFLKVDSEGEGVNETEAEADVEEERVVVEPATSNAAVEWTESVVVEATATPSNNLNFKED